jgi:hypothetical protein
MPALIPLTIAASTITAIAIAAYYLRPYWPFRHEHHPLPANAIRAQELLARQDIEEQAQTDLWSVDDPHAAPPGSLTVPRAHQLMQAHRLCTVESCPCKSSAFFTLCRAGHIVPDRRSERWAGR